MSWMLIGKIVPVSLRILLMLLVPVFWMIRRSLAKFSVALRFVRNVGVTLFVVVIVGLWVLCLIVRLLVPFWLRLVLSLFMKGRMLISMLIGRSLRLTVRIKNFRSRARRNYERVTVALD